MQLPQICHKKKKNYLPFANKRNSNQTPKSNQTSKFFVLKSFLVKPGNFKYSFVYTKSALDITPIPNPHNREKKKVFQMEKVEKLQTFTS